MGKVSFELPKKYKYEDGITNPLYKKYDGWNKISYSQVTSFKDYLNGYLQDYIIGIGSKESGIFASFGSDCGDYLNPYDSREYTLLSNEDIKILNTLKDNHPKSSQFEYEIIIDLEPFGLEKTCMQAFTDRQFYNGEFLEVTDYKTLTIKTKLDYYQSDNYKQLSVYGFGLEELGHKIGRCYVTALGRAGNTIDKSSKNVLRLTGEIIEVEKPYDRNKAIDIIRDISSTCKEISEYYRVFKKYF